MMVSTSPPATLVAVAIVKVALVAPAAKSIVPTAAPFLAMAKLAAAVAAVPAVPKLPASPAGKVAGVAKIKRSITWLAPGVPANEPET